MDLRFGPEQNIMSSTGFANMIFQVLNVKPSGFLWAAPVCSTWVYMTMGCNSFIVSILDLVLGYIVSWLVDPPKTSKKYNGSPTVYLEDFV